MSNRRPDGSSRTRYSADRRSAGIAVLVVVGVIGIILGAHGWSVRNSGAVGGNLSALSGTNGSTTTTTPSSKGTQPGSSTTQPQSTTSTSTPSSKSTQTLASAGYAPYAYEIYPAKETASTKLALAGFSYTIHPQGSNVALKLVIAGGGQTAAQKTYPSTDKLYFIDTTLGDDSGNADYSYGDDGLVATDTGGHIVQ